MRYVSVGRQFVAIFIDSIILGLAGFRWIDYQRVRTPDGITHYSFNTHGGGLLATLVLMVVYFTLMEGTLGATVGKMVMGIRVVQEDGSKCTWQGAIVRNLVRVVEWFTGYLLSAILVWSSKTRQRLGDRAGNTVVIRKGSNAGIGTGMGGTASAATMNWPTAGPAGTPPIPPPPPMPPA